MAKLTGKSVSHGKEDYKAATLQKTSQTEDNDEVQAACSAIIAIKAAGATPQLDLEVIQAKFRARPEQVEELHHFKRV